MTRSPSMFRGSEEALSPTAATPAPPSIGPTTGDTPAPNRTPRCQPADGAGPKCRRWKVGRTAGAPRILPLEMTLASPTSRAETAASAAPGAVASFGKEKVPLDGRFGPEELPLRPSRERHRWQQVLSVEVTCE